MVFELFPRNTDFSAAFVPIISEEPFAYISRLKDSFLVIQNGQTKEILKSYTKLIRILYLNIKEIIILIMWDILILVIH